VWSLIRDFNNYPVYIEGVTRASSKMTSAAMKSAGAPVQLRRPLDQQRLVAHSTRSVR